MVPGQQSTRIVDPQTQNHRNDIHSMFHCLEDRAGEANLEGRMTRRVEKIGEKRKEGRWNPHHRTMSEC